MGKEGLTYHEKRALGFGTAKERLGKDSLGNFDDCRYAPSLREYTCFNPHEVWSSPLLMTSIMVLLRRLSLCPAVDPVATPQGILFSREAVLKYLLAQKKEIKRKNAEYEAYQARKRDTDEQKRLVEEEARIMAFDRLNHAGHSTARAAEVAASIQASAETHNGATGAIVIAEVEARRQADASFWGADKVPEAEVVLEKPDADVRCPITGKKLKLKDLIDVKFTTVNAATTTTTTTKIDPITKDLLTNRSRLALIKTTGDVVLWTTWEKVIKPDGVFKERLIKPIDVIELKGGGTGFVAHDKEDVEAKRHTQLGIGSGMAPLRGQGISATSNFGLRFNN